VIVTVVQTSTNDASLGLVQVSILPSSLNGCASPTPYELSLSLESLLRTNTSIVYSTPLGAHIVSASWSFSPLVFIASLLDIDVFYVELASGIFVASLLILWILHRCVFKRGEYLVLLSLLFSLVSTTSIVGFIISIYQYAYQYQDETLLLIASIAIGIQLQSKDE
jgi:hypothetical protein